MGLKKTLAMMGFAATAVLGGVEISHAETQEKNPDSSTKIQYTIDGIPTTKEGHFDGDAIREALKNLPVSTLKKILVSEKDPNKALTDISKIVSNGNKSVENACSWLLANYEAQKSTNMTDMFVLVCSMLGASLWGIMGATGKSSTFKTMAITAGLVAGIAGYRLATPMKLSDITEKEIQDTVVKGYEIVHNNITKFGIPNPKYDKRWGSVPTIKMAKQMIEIAQKVSGVSK